MVGFLGCKHTLLGHVEHDTPKYCSSGLLSIHSPPSLYLCLGLPQPICRTLHLALLRFEVLTGPPLKSVQVHLDGIPSLQHVKYTTQLGVVSKLPESALDSTAHVANKDVKQHWSQYQPLRNATHHCDISHKERTFVI